MAQLPSIDELRKTNEANLSAPAGELASFFAQLTVIGSNEFIADLSTLTWLLGGAWILSAVAIVSGITHLLVGDREPVFRFVIAMVAGTVYGVVKIIRSRVRFVDKASGQDITFTVPFSIGFAVGLFGFGLEALLSLSPIPSVVPATLLFALFFFLWFRRRPPERKLYDQLPHLGFSAALMRMAQPDAPASISWRGSSYDANASLQNGIRVTCRAGAGPHGSGFELIAEHPPGKAWRYSQPRLVVDFVNLEHETTPNGTRVRATNSAPSASTKNLVDALNIATNALR